MNSSRVRFFQHLLLVLFNYVQTQGIYKVIGPKVIRPLSVYTLAVGLHGSSESTGVTATLQGVSVNGSIYLVEDNVIIPANSSRICSLQVSDVQPGSYKIIVSGRGGVPFVSDYPVELLNQSFTVLIQTDRPIYKPDSNIQFRVLVLNADLKPAAELRLKRIRIELSDGQGNIVKEWRGLDAPQGVFAGEFRVSKRPVLGQWKMSVFFHNQNYSRTFQVARYVLPKFDVHIDTTPHITFSEKYISVSVRTNIKNGKPIHGELTVTVYPIINSAVIQPIFQNPVRRVLKIEGYAHVDFDILKDLNLSDEYERTVVVEAIVEEFGTSRRQNNTFYVHIHKYPYKINILRTADYFKPGLKYTATVIVSNHDGSKLASDIKEITIRHGFSREDEVYIEQKYPLDSNGGVKLDIWTPLNCTNNTALRIEAQLADLKERMSPVPAAVSFSNTFLQVLLKTERPVVNLPIEVAINCTEPMKYVEYVVLGRGEVLLAHTSPVPNSKFFVFQFTATHRMSPRVRLIVTYTRPTGELIGDAVDMHVDGSLQNFIDIESNSIDYEPESDVNLRIRTQPNSYVGIIAIDKNILNYGTDFALNEKLLNMQLNEYDAMESAQHLLQNSKSEWHPGANNPHSAVYEAGADLLTNAHINRQKPTLEDVYLRPQFYDISTVKPDRGYGVQLQPVTRPPLAGPYAFSRIPKPVWNEPKIFLDNDFANTWLFTNFSSGFDGNTSMRRKLSSTLTRWHITGFTLNPIHGLGLTQKPLTVTVSKRFSVHMDLPYAVYVGETLAVSVTVQNLGFQDLQVDCTLHNPHNQFEFADISNEINSTRKIDLFRRKVFRTLKRGSRSTTFLITTLRAGLIDLKVTASSSKLQDEVQRKLLVLHAGETEYYNQAVLFDLREKANLSAQLNLTIPPNVVPNSEVVEVSVVSDLLGPTVFHLGSLIRQPSVSSEHNLLNIMVPVITMHYIDGLGQRNVALFNEAVRYLELAYQQQLRYRLDDGSFSSLSGAKGSVWSTAYAALALSLASAHVYVEPKIINNAWQWLEQHQNGNGSFYETANIEIVHLPLQNPHRKSLALTAFVIIALMETKTTRFTNVLDKGLDYVARYISDDEDTYTLALCTYALQLSKHVSKQSAFNLFESRSKSDGNNLKWWVALDGLMPWNKHNVTRFSSLDVEVSAYGLLALVEANLLNDAIPTLNWLLNQQSNLGGFTTSSDTVVALLAIYRLSQKLGYHQPNINVEFEYKKNEKQKFSINPNSAAIVQTMQINNKARQINVTATGNGIALFRLSYRYNVNVTGPLPQFILDPQIDKNSDRHHLQMSICTSFVRRNLSGAPHSNMAAMEVNLPSGYTVNVDSLPSLEVSEHVVKVQTANGLGKVLMFFTNISADVEYCPTVSAFQTYKIANLKPTYVVVYDYYDSIRRARQFYLPIQSDVCDICEKEDCSSICAPARYSSVSVKDEPRLGSSKDFAAKSPNFFDAYVIFCVIQIIRLVLM